MKKYLVSIIFVILFIALFASGNVFAFAEKTFYNISYEIDCHDVEIITIDKTVLMGFPFSRTINKNILSENRALELTKEFDLNYENFMVSYGVKIQIENVSPHWGDCCCDTPELPSTLHDYTDRQIRFRTFIYLHGFTQSGARMYEVSSNVSFVEQLPEGRGLKVPQSWLGQNSHIRYTSQMITLRR